MNIHVSSRRDPDSYDFLAKAIDASDAKFTVDGGNRTPLQIILSDEAETIIAGLDGESLNHWLWIDIIWVRDDLRLKGLGSQLMDAAEEEARRRGHIGIYLDTYDFQALDFYKTRGYEVYGQIDDFPPGHTSYAMKKRL